MILVFLFILLCIFWILYVFLFQSEFSFFKRLSEKLAPQFGMWVFSGIVRGVPEGKNVILKKGSNVTLAPSLSHLIVFWKPSLTHWDILSIVLTMLGPWQPWAVRHFFLLLSPHCSFSELDCNCEQGVFLLISVFLVSHTCSDYLSTHHLTIHPLGSCLAAERI